MTIWFTSDWHLYHTNIMKYCHRPFNTVEAMNEAIISNFNSNVVDNDTVYYLGDFCLPKAQTSAWIENLFVQLHGKMFFIVGNHDKRNVSIFEKYCEAVWDLRDITVDGQRITLCHYPLYSHNKSHFNAWLLYGHHHWDTSVVIPGKKMNICVDNHNFMPVSFDQVKLYMESRGNNWDFIPEESRRI